MTGENGYPETPDWSPEPHADPFTEVYVWLDTLTISERLAAINDRAVPPNVILGGAGE